MKFTAHCINLKKRPERWSLFSQQNIPFAVNRFEAIEMKQGNIGCTLSHIEVMKKCKPDEYLLIFEDDAEILGSWELFFNALDQLPENFDVLYLGANVWTAEELRLNEKWEVKQYSENLHTLMGGWCLHAYFVGYEFCQRIINTPIEQIHQYRNLDTYFARRIQPQGNCYMIEPMMAVQRMNYSDIANEERRYDMLSKFTNLR
jgi:hypothetical protein